MPKPRPPAEEDESKKLDAELAEFASFEPTSPADPEFRERLRAELWILLERLVAGD